MTVESPAPRIERLEARLLRVPLRRPYQLSFGDLEAFDTLLVEVTDSDGRLGLGEATLLPAYSGESAADAWRLTEDWVEIGRSGSIDSLVATVAGKQAEPASWQRPSSPPWTCSEGMHPFTSRKMRGCRCWRC